MDKRENTAKQLRRIRKLFEQKKFAKAEEVIREALSHDPDEPLFHIAHAVSFSKRRDHDAALKILDVAKERFPNHFSILYHRAETLYRLGKFQEAEHEYRASIALTPPDRRVELGESYNGLGLLLWHQARCDEALEAWRQALNNDPTNKRAKANLEQFSNEFGEPVRFSPLDDVWHFHRIMKEQYLKAKGLTEFRTKREAERVMKAIMQTWNEYVAPRSRELDTMTAAEKTSFFESLREDFTKQFAAPTSPNPMTPSETKKSEKSKASSDEERFLEMMDVRFGFLPNGGGVKLLLFGIPALAAVGISLDRFAEMMKGDVPTEDEEERLDWAHDLVEEIIAATIEKGNPEEIEAMMTAMEIAREELDEQTAVYVVQSIRQRIEEL
jgi:hypothetical protein